MCTSRLTEVPSSRGRPLSPEVQYLLRDMGARLWRQVLQRTDRLRELSTSLLLAFFLQPLRLRLTLPLSSCPLRLLLLALLLLALLPSRPLLRTPTLEPKYRRRRLLSRRRWRLRHPNRA